MRLTLRFFIAIAALSFGFMQTARAQDSTAYIVTYFETASQSKDEALALARQLGEASRKDGGNLRFEVLQRIGQSHHFAILEAWKDAPAQAAHAAAAHTKTFRDKLRPLLSSAYDERPHTALSVGPVQPSGATRNSIYAVTHVDIVPTQKDVGIAMTKQLGDTSRSSDGNMRFEVLQQNSRPNHMTVTEIWRDQKAVDAHAVAAHTKKYREELLPMSGSLYDERLYKIVD